MEATQAEQIARSRFRALALVITRVPISKMVWAAGRLAELQREEALR